MSDAHLEISSRRAGTAMLITASGELDMASAPLLRDSIDRDSVDHAELIVLDLAGVSFIDSSGLHALMALHDDLGERLRIVASPVCARLFELTGVAGVLPLAAS